MLAAHFLNVVLEENEAGIPEKENEPEDEESNNNTIYDIISQLDIKSQLAKILLSECTIEPSKIAQKREKPVLRFEANVTPIYNVPPKKPKPNDELSLLTAVEAVYSDGEENEGSDESSPMVPCPVCNRSFSRNCSLALHMKSHEPLDEHFRRYQCNFCPRSFPQKSILKKHIMECAMQRGFSPTLFAQEQQDGGPMNPPRRYECQFCHRSYTQKSVLKKHLVVHTGERERCNICGAGFSQRSSLVRHAKRIHGGLLNHAIGTGGGGPSSISSHSGIPSGNGISPTISQVITSVGGIHNTPILTTALSGVTHPTLGTPLIVGIPLNQLAAGKFAGTQFAATAGSILGRHPGLTALNTQTPPKAHGSGFPNLLAGGTSKAVPAAIPINLARLNRIVPLNNMKNLVNNTTTSSAPAMSSHSTSDPILTASLNRNINPAPIPDVTKAIFDSTEEKSDPPDASISTE